MGGKVYFCCFELRHKFRFLEISQRYLLILFPLFVINPPATPELLYCLSAQVNQVVDPRSSEYSHTKYSCIRIKYSCIKTKYSHIRTNYSHIRTKFSLVSQVLQIVSRQNQILSQQKCLLSHQNKTNKQNKQNTLYPDPPAVYCPGHFPKFL